MLVRNKKFISISLIVLLIGVGVFMFRDDLLQLAFRPTDTDANTGVNLEQLTDNEPETIANNLTVPWDVAVLPNGELLVTERSGRLRLINQDRIITVDGVEEVGEGGLLGVALHPEFDQNQQIYLYQTTRLSDDSLVNRVVRYHLDGDTLSDPETIINNIPGASYHDGGQLAFGSDGLLYITTGDAGNEDSAQDTESLAGKILRVTTEGDIPSENPFNNEVYSFGHRNPQGLAWDDSGQLWSSEHGRSGLQSGFDELNKIEAGGNYGWPEIQGDETHNSMITPVLHSGPDETWAPASLAFADGSLFFGGLRGQTLYEVTDYNNSPKITAHFRNDYGRLRAVVINKDSLLFTTSNQDGRGDPVDTDDRLIKVTISSLRN